MKLAYQGKLVSHYETWQHHSKETRKHKWDLSLATAKKHTHPTTSANQAESPNSPWTEF
jgi:uncharacterized protein YdeI (YjbR/CyaY-like superfamily)